MAWSEQMVQRVICWSFCCRSFCCGEFADLGGCDVLEGADHLQDGAKRDDLKQEERAGGFPVLRLETPGACRERQDRSVDGLAGPSPDRS
jgi:hypothetical protein